LGRVIAWVAGIVAAVALVVYGSFAIYEGSWSLAAHNTQHQLQIQQQQANGQASIAANGWSFQTMLGQQITTGISNVTTVTTEIASAQAQGMTAYANQLMAQREADGNDVCQKATEVNGSLPQGASQTKWIEANCSNGSISPSSKYYYVGQ